VLLAVHDAVVLNKAHMEQYVYVGGGAINEARVVKARIGSPIGDLIEECGGFRGEAASVVVNDPLCGWAAADLDEAVDKRTRSVIALSPEEAHRAPLRPCVRCGSCVDACPEGLEPYMLYKLIAVGRRDEAMERGLGRCSSCAACSWACWSRLPLVTAFDAAKGAEGA
jgi:electron transport complex protein RnfC